jgi:hypothetical protein
MRYLRMFSNAAIAAALGAVYLAVLTLQLNPMVPLYPMNLAGLLLTLGLYYGVHLAALFYGVIVFRQILSSDVFSPGWISLRVLSWLLVLDAGGAAALMWLNLLAYAPMVRLETARRMAAGAAVLTACALVFLGVSLAHYTFGRRRGRVGGTVVALALVASLVVPLAVRGPGSSLPLFSRPLDLDIGIERPAHGGRVTMVLLDGGSLDFVSTAALAGRLPNFGRILDRGAAMHVNTHRPTQPDPVWTAVATGKLPWKSGVRSAARYQVRLATDRLELLPENCFAQGLITYGLVGWLPHDARSLRARPLWSILATAGLTTGVVNWPLTYPAQPVRGYLVSDRFYRPGDAWLEPDDPSAIYPVDLLPAARLAGDRARRLAGASAVAEAGGVAGAGSAAGAGARVEGGEGGDEPTLTDRMYDEIARGLRERHHPHLSAVRFRQLDQAGHEYLRYAMPAAFGDVTSEERRRYGQVLELAYARVDAMIGRVMATLGEDDLLLVVSGYGMEPLPMWKRAVERAIGNPSLSGTHENAPDGFLLAYGASVSPGRKRRASIVDVAPTVLYFLGLPVGRDMDGYARTDIFVRDFVETRPIAFIPTYER